MNKVVPTTKNIFIVRHGHADFNGPSDFDRELTDQGIGAVKKTAKFIREACLSKSLTPQLCLSSAAIRTKQTSKIIQNENNIEFCKYDKKLYSTEVNTWLDLISEQKFDNLIIVGHNPTFSKMINVLCGVEVYMQPANCAFITLQIKTDGYVYPAKLHELYKNE